MKVKLKYKGFNKATNVNDLYSDDEFIKRFDAIDRFERIYKIVSIPINSDAEHKINAIAAYYKSESAPKLLFPRESVSKSLGKVQSHHSVWVKDTLRKTKNQIENGYKIHGDQFISFSDHNFWEDLDRESCDDKLIYKRPHRFYFFPQLALSTIYGCNVSLSAINTLLVSWQKFANEHENGIPYDSNLLIVQRILNLTITWNILLGVGEEYSFIRDIILKDIIKIIAVDVWILEKRLGYSAANNHLLADYFAGWFIGFCWGEISGINNKKLYYEKKWIEECCNQIYPDGSGFEHSTHYHKYACQQGALYLLLMDKNSQRPEAMVSSRIKNAIKFQLNLSVKDGAIMHGDGTGDPMYCVDSTEWSGCALWSSLLVGLFGESDIKFDESLENQTSFWLLGGVIKKLDDVVKVDDDKLIRYEVGGYYLIFDELSKTKLYFRTGPNKYANTYGGHMHSDLLSINVSVNDELFILDPGTYTYRNVQPKGQDDQLSWRSYFSGNKAHNNLKIREDEPISSLIKDFRPRVCLQYVNTTYALNGEYLGWVEADIQKSRHYSNMTRGVLNITGEYILVYDVLPSDISNDKVWGTLQLVESANISKPGANKFDINVGDKNLMIAFDEELLDSQILSGSNNPKFGWLSNKYGEIIAAPGIHYTLSSTKFVSGFLISAGNCLSMGFDNLVIQETETKNIKIIVHTKNYSDHIYINRQLITEKIVLKDLSYCGRILWVRELNDGKFTIKTLMASYLSYKNKNIIDTSEKHAEDVCIENYH